MFRTSITDTEYYNLPAIFESWENTSVMMSLLGISCPIRLRSRIESLPGPIQFPGSVSAPETASAHIESLLRVPTVGSCCRIPHAAFA